MKSKIEKILKDKNLQILCYKILNDLMAYLMLAMFLCLLVESALPGMVSKNNGFVIVLSLIFADFIVLSFLGKKLHISYAKKKHHALMPFAIFVSFMLIGNSLLKFPFWANIIITTLSLLILAVLYQLVFSKKD